MSELTKLTISESVQGLKEKNFSVCELVKDYIQNMEAGRGYNAYVLETPERALKEAEKADERYQHGTNRPLEGITLGVKDLFCTKGVRSTACSKILENFVPPYESTVTNNLFESGAIMLGKLNMDEFAMGGSNENSYFKPVVNPWSKDVPLVPGGSSGGSVAAVAAQMCAMATGSDTGGSIRLPASFCGVTGMKPTYGRCSRYGMIAFASSLDQAGPITKDVRDCAMVLKAMSGFDPKDSTSSKREVPDFEKVLGQSVKGLKIGLVEEYRADGLNKEIAQAWDNAAQILKDAGAEVVSVHLPHTKYALPAYYIIAPAEASSNLARYDGIRYGFRADGSKPEEIYINTRTEGFGREVKRRVMIGTYVLSAGYYDAYYLKALKVRRLIADDFAKAFEQCDVILAPTSPMTAFPIGDKAMKENPLNMYLNDVYTVSVNLAGLPALSLPVCLSKEGLPIGMQLIGRAFDEETIFKTAFALEQNSGFRRR